jgi:sec-independent protein translocase protein TatB
MFDIAFSELVVVGIVALIVIGPEKMPKVARTVGHLLGRAQRYVNEVKSDVNRELHFEDLQKLQDEIRQNTQHAGSTQYQVGQIIKHEIQQTESAKYQVGQIIHHKMEHEDDSTPEQPLPATVADPSGPTPPKQSVPN